MSSDVTQRLLELIADVLEVDAKEVRPESHFFNDLGASSLDIAEMVWRIEDEAHFGVSEIPDEVLENVRCVADVIDFIEGQHHAPPAASVTVDVALGSDGASEVFKDLVAAHLKASGLNVKDLGPKGGHNAAGATVEAVAGMVASGEARFGVLIDGAGVGACIAANKVVGVRAASVADFTTARLARQLHDANVICLGARLLGPDVAKSCLDTFLAASFTPGDTGENKIWMHQLKDLERRLSEE